MKFIDHLYLAYITGFILFVQCYVLAGSIDRIRGEGSPSILLLQPMTDDYHRYDWEWNSFQYPLSMIELSQLSAYYYAQRHGYDYQSVVVPSEFFDLVDRHPCWSKIYALHMLMSNTSLLYDYIVVFDTDTAFMQPKVSLVDKMEEWTKDEDGEHPGISTTSTSEQVWREVDVFMPQDDTPTRNWMTPFGSESLQLNVNTGFQIWKVSDKTRHLVHTWLHCNTLVNEGCDHYNHQWPFDQGGFNYIRNYLRDEMEMRLQIIPCLEANGFPTFIPNIHYGLGDLSTGHCLGKFFAHFWQEAKRNAVPYVMDLVLAEMMEMEIRSIQRQSMTRLI